MHRALVAHAVRDELSAPPILMRRLRRGSQVVRQESAKLLYAGSIPTQASAEKSLECFRVEIERTSISARTGESAWIRVLY